MSSSSGDGDNASVDEGLVHLLLDSMEVHESRSVDEVGGDKVARLAVSTVDLVGVPSVVGRNNGEGVGSERRGRPTVLNLVGLVHALHRRKERVSVRDDSGEGEGRVEASEERTVEDKLANLRLDGQVEKNSTK